MPVEIVPQNSGLIEPRRRRFDLRALGRLSAWGGAAAAALAVAAFASQTDTGSERLAKFVAGEPPTPAAVAIKVPPQREQEWEIARLQNQVRTLAADRDRLADRVAGLEHSLEDVTGSIKRQAVATVPQPETSAPSRAPAISAPATIDAKAETPSTNTPPNVTAAPAPSAAQSPHEAEPMPPARVAALPPEPTPAPAPKPEIGVALATSSNLEVLHLQWAALKANFGPALAGLRPTAAREQRGTSTVYRLVVGPLPNMASATKLCARLTAARAVCHTGKFSGDPL